MVLPSGRLPLLSIAWEVHHRSNPSSIPLCNLGESSLERKLLIFANTLRGRHPSPIQFLYQPSLIGIVLDSAHQAPSHCYNIHPKLSTHHLGLCQYQNLIPVLQDNLARTWWHMVRGCDPYIQHIGTELNPISNLVSHCIFRILVFKDGEVYLHACFFSVLSTSSGMPWSMWVVRSGWHWRCHWWWTPITLETTVWGWWRKCRWLRPLVSLSPIAFLASRGLMGWLWIVRTTISRHIFWRESC